MCWRDCVSTWIVTSAGISWLSIRWRVNSNSVSDAAGKPISIVLKPRSTRCWKNFSFCSRFIGISNAWLPSRKSTLHQRGALVRVRLGHWRSGKLTGGNGWYFWTFFMWVMLLSSFSTLSGAIKKVFRLCLRDERLFKDFRGTTALHRIQRCTLRVQANDIRPIPCLDNGRTRRVLLPCRQRFSAYTQR